MKLKNLKSLVASRDIRWNFIDEEHINTSKYKAIKNLNDTLNNLLNQKNKLAELVKEVRKMEASSSNEISC